MSQPRSSSAESKANAADFWDRTPEQLKSYEKANQILAKAEEARWRIQKELLVMCGAGAILTVAFAACLFAILFQKDPRDSQPAWAILSSMVAGVFSYLAGKAAR